MKYHCLRLFFLLVFRFFTSPAGRHGWPILTIHTSKCAVLRKEVPFAGLDDNTKCLGCEIPQKPQFLGRNRHFKPNFRKLKSQYLRRYKSDRRKILNVASGHQADFVGGLKIKSNEIQDCGGRHFEKKENVHNSAAIWDVFTKFGVLVAIDSLQRPRVSFFGYSKIQDGGRPPFWKTENRNISAAVWAIDTKFGTVVDMDSPQRALTSFLTCNKIQDGGRPPFWKKENVHNSAAIWDIFTKFGMLVAMASPQRPRMSFLGYSNIQDGGRPPFWKAENRNISAAIWAIVTKFGMMVDMDSPQRAVTSFLTCTCNKIQDGGRPPFWKKENVHNSAAVWVIFTQVGMLVAIDSPQRFLIWLLVYNKIQGLFIFYLHEHEQKMFNDKP